MAMLVLGSASPRRAELLRAAGYAFAQRPSGCAEAARAREDARAQVRRLAEEKAQACLRRAPDAVVLAADTLVVQQGRRFGKPADRAEYACAMRLRSDARHEVISGVCVASRAHRRVFDCTTEVEFAALDAAWIEAYWDSGEPRDKAGGYAIQGQAGLRVRAVFGSYTNVVGLPMAETQSALAEFGVHPRGAGA